MKPLLRWILNSVLPASCLLCSEPVESDGQFCISCFRRVNFITSPFCACCGVPFNFQPALGKEQLCMSCNASPPAYNMARAAIRYDEVARRMILPFKYGDKAEAAPHLAWLMHRAGGELLQRADLLVPVPLHSARLRQRRYNQAALLARSLAKLTGLAACLDALVRTRATAALEGMDATARRKELEGAMSLKSGVGIQGQHILLIDDVMTTGATAHQCARVLRSGGARQVDVLTIARVEDPRLTQN